MSGTIADQLDGALEQLAEALSKAKNAIGAVDTDDGALRARIESYEEILKKQKGLVRDLAAALGSENWDEARRLSGLVRESSLMIKSDAGFIMDWLKNPNLNQSKEEYQA